MPAKQVYYLIYTSINSNYTSFIYVSKSYILKILRLKVLFLFFYYTFAFLCSCAVF